MKKRLTLEVPTLSHRELLVEVAKNKDIICINTSMRESDIGKALLLSSLYAMWEMGYTYAIIGGGDGVEGFYKSVGAIEIEGSKLGIYRDFFNK